MASSYPSVHGFYSSEPILGATVTPNDPTPSGPGDGFTKEEVENALDPLKTLFNPSREYLQCDIGSLTPGPQAVTFFGRVVNFNTQYGKSKSHAAATGWHHMIVKDDTGGICVNSRIPYNEQETRVDFADISDKQVKLYFTNKPYTLKLGLLLTIWTPYIGTVVNNKSFIVPNAPNTTSIFPGREGSVHIVIHESSDKGETCRIPLAYSKGKILPGLMTLKSFINGASEIKHTKILGCVKSIGPTKKIISKKGTISDLTEVTIFDDTAEIMLKLWGTYRLSAREWKPSQTILLLSNPTFRLEHRGSCSISVSHATMVDLDPEFPDAEWLRKYATNLYKKESVDQMFPDDLWDVGSAMSSTQRIYYTIAEVDDCVRSDPHINFTGFLSLTLMEVNLVLQYRRNMLMCSQCCGVPVYASTRVAKCKTCDNDVELQLNPKIIGTMIDETGSISPGRLLWSGQAWEQLFGRPVDKLDDMITMKLIEQRMLYMRIHFLFGWAEEVGKLAILAVRM